MRLYLHKSVNAFLTMCPGQHFGISHEDCCYNVSVFAFRMQFTKVEHRATKGIIAGQSVMRGSGD